MKPLLILIITSSSGFGISAQGILLHPLSSDYFSKLSLRTADLIQKLDKKSERALAQWQKKKEGIKLSLNTSNNPLKTKDNFLCDKSFA